MRDSSTAEDLQRRLPKAWIVKAFSTLAAPVLEAAAWSTSPVVPGMPHASDDAEAGRVTAPDHGCPASPRAAGPPRPPPDRAARRVPAPRRGSRIRRRRRPHPPSSAGHRSQSWPHCAQASSEAQCAAPNEHNKEDTCHSPLKGRTAPRYRRVAGHWPRDRGAPREGRRDGRADLQCEQGQRRRDRRRNRGVRRQARSRSRPTLPTLPPFQPCSTGSTASSSSVTATPPSTSW